MKGFKSFNISQRELENFCHGLKGNLEEQYVRFWKDQIQKQENQGKPRTFKKFKTNLNFEEYKRTKRTCKLCNFKLNEVGNKQHYLMQFNI